MIGYQIWCYSTYGSTHTPPEDSPLPKFTERHQGTMIVFQCRAKAEEEKRLWDEAYEHDGMDDYMTTRILEIEISEKK